MTKFGNMGCFTISHITFHNVTLYFPHVVFAAKHNKIFPVLNEKSDQDLVKLGKEQQT